MKMSNKKIGIIIPMLLFFSCMKNHEPSSVISNSDSVIKGKQITQHDTLDSNGNLTEEENEVALIEFNGDSGVIDGFFHSAQQGDYRHLQIRDSLGRYGSFFISPQSNITEKEFSNMEDGKYSNKKIRVYWKEEAIMSDQPDRVDLVMYKIEYL